VLSTRSLPPDARTSRWSPGASVPVRRIRAATPVISTAPLRRLGARAPRTTGRPTYGPLTGRERDVADLVARGHSSKPVAATLHLSGKTVANTPTRVYAKLGVRSRTQLAHIQPC
jgi:DNA-binding CsgD family transcriptional regulator